MPPKQERATRVSFARPDAIVYLYDSDGAALPPESGWPAIQIHEVDAAVHRQHGGVPLRSGEAHYVLPLDAMVVPAGQARVRDLRTGSVTEWTVTRIDDMPQTWSVSLTLAQRRLPLGVA